NKSNPMTTPLWCAPNEPDPCPTNRAPIDTLPACVPVLTRASLQLRSIWFPPREVPPSSAGLRTRRAPVPLLVASRSPPWPRARMASRLSPETLAQSEDAPLDPNQVVGPAQ